MFPEHEILELRREIERWEHACEADRGWARAAVEKVIVHLGLSAARAAGWSPPPQYTMGFPPEDAAGWYDVVSNMGWRCRGQMKKGEFVGTAEPQGFPGSEPKTVRWSRYGIEYYCRVVDPPKEVL